MSTDKKLVTLHYFGVRGRAEPIRLVLEELQVPYNDNLIVKDWPQLKEKFPFKQVPVYEEKHPSGDESKTLIIPQTQAILRYLGRKHKIYGKSEEETLRCDIAQELAIDCAMDIVKFVWNPKAKEIKDEFVAKTLVPRLEMVEKFKKENPDKCHFVGNSFTFVDAMMWSYLDVVRAISVDTLKKFPALAEFKQKFESRPNIAAYLKSGRRPAIATAPHAFYCNTPETS